METTFYLLAMFKTEEAAKVAYAELDAKLADFGLPTSYTEDLLDFEVEGCMIYFAALLNHHRTLDHVVQFLEEKFDANVAWVSEDTFPVWEYLAMRIERWGST